MGRVWKEDVVYTNLFRCMFSLCESVYTHFFKKRNGFHKRIFGNHLIFNTMFIYKNPISNYLLYKRKQKHQMA